MRTPRLARLLLLALVLVAPALVPTSAGAVASTATAVDGRVRGEILGAGAGQPKVKVTWFTDDYGFLGSTRAEGAYSLSLDPGTYRLQFTDLRPTYDVGRYQPTDVRVTVSENETTVRTVRMKVGAAIGGKVRAGGKPAAKARVVVALPDERTFTTTADKKGNYALGGLPSGKGFSVFTYDRKKAWVAKSVFLSKLTAGTYRAVSPRLSTKAGSLLVDLYTDDGAYDGDPAYVTAVSRTTGQFWTARSRDGSVTFTGLYPGRYRLVVPGLDDFLGTTVTPDAKVRPGRTAFADARLTERGASVTGTVVDGNRPTVGLANAVVSLLDADGDVLGTTTSASGGTYTFEGQLTTANNLTVVAAPAANNPYLGQGTSYCKYAETASAAFGITTGQQTTLEPLGLDHLPDAQQDGEQCHTPAPRPQQETP